MPLVSAPVSHEDSFGSDQMFKAFRAMVRLRTFCDLASFVKQLNYGYPSIATRPTFVMVNSILDWDSWLRPVKATLHGHQKPLELKFEADDSKQVRMWFKPDTDAKEWQGPVSVLTRVPDGQPAELDRPLTFSPEVQKGVRSCFPFASADQRDWLRAMLDGKLGLTIDPELKPGHFGHEATLKVGDTVATFQCIKGAPGDMWTIPAGSVRIPLSADNRVDVDEVKVPVRRQGAASSDAPFVPKRRHGPPMRVINHPIARKPPKIARDAVGDNRVGSGAPIFLRRNVQMLRETFQSASSWIDSSQYGGLFIPYIFGRRECRRTACRVASITRGFVQREWETQGIFLNVQCFGQASPRREWQS